jgi:formiminoglutamase
MALKTDLKFKPTSKELFFSRQDPEDPRLGELFKPFEWSKFEEHLKVPSWVVLGYPDDDGIKLNGGRPGSSAAPPLIRKYLYKMTPFTRADFKLFDAGDMVFAGLSLADRHEAAKQNALRFMQKGARLLTLGGGHDYGYPDTAAFALWCQSQKQRPLVINFDAHLDVRPTDKGFHSGTPFHRLVTEFDELDFLEVGLQRNCNSLAHDEWLQDEGGRRIYIEDWQLSGLSLGDLVFDEIQDWLIRPRPAFISVDMDCFIQDFLNIVQRGLLTGTKGEASKTIGTGP